MLALIVCDALLLYYLIFIGLALCYTSVIVLVHLLLRTRLYTLLDALENSIVRDNAAGRRIVYTDLLFLVNNTLRSNILNLITVFATRHTIVMCYSTSVAFTDKRSQWTLRYTDVTVVKYVTDFCFTAMHFVALLI